MEWIAQYWPFGTSGLGITVGVLIILVVLKFVAGMVVRLVSIGIVAAGVGFWAFPGYMPFKIPFLAAGSSSGPQWVLVSSAGRAVGEDVAYSVSATPKMAIKGMPVCDENNIGKVAVCGAPGLGEVMGMAGSGLPTDISMTSMPTGVCTYKTPTTSDFLSEDGEHKVYQCKD
jgi:hypothetical protein